jgi:hypothetical protein
MKMIMQIAGTNIGLIGNIIGRRIGLSLRVKQRQARHKDIGSCVALHDSDSHLSQFAVMHYLKKNARPSITGVGSSLRHHVGCTLTPLNVT